MSQKLSPFMHIAICDNFLEIRQEVLDILPTLAAKAAGYEGEAHNEWTSSNILDKDGSTSKLIKVEMLLRDLNVDVITARIMVLGSKGKICKHTDSFLGDTIARIHMPIRSNDHVEFYIDSVPACWKEGELWYGDFRKTHWGENRGDEARVHLVFDVTVNEKLKKWFDCDAVCNEFFGTQNYTPVTQNNYLTGYCVSFKLPAGFSVPGLFDQPINSDISAAIKMHNEALYLFLDDSPFLTVTAVSPTVIAVDNLPVAITLEYDFFGARPAEGYVCVDNLNRVEVMVDCT